MLVCELSAHASNPSGPAELFRSLYDILFESNLDRIEGYRFGRAPRPRTRCPAPSLSTFGRAVEASFDGHVYGRGGVAASVGDLHDLGDVVPG